MKQMQDYARNELDRPNAWGLSGWNDWGPEWIIAWPYMAIISGQDPFAFYDNFTYEYVESWHSPDSKVWEPFRFYNKAYRAGVWNPESHIT
jgi:hypothetical protein